MEKNETTIVIVIMVAIVLLFSGFGMMGFGGYGMHNMADWMYGTGFGFMWIFGMIIWILIITALVLFILWLVKQLESQNKRK